MNPAKSVYAVRAAISSRVRDGSISSSVSGSTEPSRCTCNSACGSIQCHNNGVPAVDSFPSLTSFELHLHAEGSHHESYRMLGAHLVQDHGLSGVRFAV